MNSKSPSSSLEQNPADKIPLPAAWLEEGSSTICFNRIFRELPGISERMGKLDLLEWVHSGDKANLQQLLESTIRKEEKIYIRIKDREGQFRWHCLSWKPFQGEGSTSGILCLFQDIHDFYQQKPQLVNRFQKIFNETLQFTSLLDNEGRLLEVNKSALDFGEYLLENIRGQYLWKAGWWKEDPEVGNKFQNAISETAKGKIFQSEETIYGAAGQEVVIDFSLKPIHNEDGEIQHLIAEGRDITELKQTRDQLKHSENLWRMLVTNTPDIIVRHDTSFKITYINPAIEQITGLYPSNFLGKYPQEIPFPPAVRQKYIESLKESYELKKQISYSTELSADKKEISLFVTFTPEINEAKEVESLLVTTRNISDLKEKENQLARANKELLISSAKLQTILDSTNELICARDLNLRLLACNKAFEEDYLQIFGEKPEIGASIDVQLEGFPQEKDKMLDFWKRAVQGEEYTVFQEFMGSNSLRKYYEITYSSMLDPQGNIIGATAVSRDLTKERRIEKELKDAREFLILAENLPQIVFTTGLNGIPDYLNQAFYEYTGIEKMDFNAPFGKQFIHTTDRKALALAWKDAVNKQEGLHQEIRLRQNTGEYRWNHIRFLPLVNPQGNLVKWIGSVTDIHDAKTSEEQQRLAAREFRQLSESLPQIIWTANPDGKFNYLNDKWYEYTGEYPLKALGSSWIDFVHPDDQELVIKAWENSVANKEDYTMEYRLLNLTGQYRWFLAKALPLLDADDEVVKWFGSATEIHDQKLQNKRLWQQNLQLNQINQYLDNFVHTAAHDLRAPIVNIKGLLSLLEDSSEDKKEQIFQSLKISTDRLDSTLQGMIQLIEAQSQTGDLSRNLNVREVFMEIFTEFREELSEIDYELLSDFANCHQINFVLPYLTSTFRNLISNSIKYRKKEQKLNILVKCRQQDDFLIFTYQDNGIGIDLNRHGKNIFRPFRRFTSQGSGKGIGMHIVKNMMVKSGGNIKIESELGKGTTFKLFLKNQPEILPDEDLLYPNEN